MSIKIQECILEDNLIRFEIKVQFWGKRIRIDLLHQKQLQEKTGGPRKRDQSGDLAKHLKSLPATHGGIISVFL